MLKEGKDFLFIFCSEECGFEMKKAFALDISQAASLTTGQNRSTDLFTIQAIQVRLRR